MNLSVNIPPSPDGLRRAGKNWIVRSPAPEEFLESLSKLLASAGGGQILNSKFQNSGSLRLIGQMLWNRGIKESEEIKKFLEPDYELHTHDPFLLKGMERAVERVGRAIKNKEKIIVFADYDADGVCGSVVLSDFLKATGADFEVRIPDRFKEAYGLTTEKVEEYGKLGAKLIITIDCGVTDYDEIELANSKGIDVIVLDHHIVPPKWPRALAIIDHKQEDDTYPEKVLCGTGLAFKLVQGLLKNNNWGLVKGWEKWLLDAVAIATVADMVPLTGENRVLVKYGITVLRRNRRLGLKKLLEMKGIDSAGVTSETIGFQIAPRINAASRMDHANTAYGLLTTENENEAEWLAKRLEEKNAERRVIVESILAELGQKIGNKPEEGIIFEGSSEWPAGVLGIAANRLVESFGCPVFLYSLNGDVAKGSCRAPAGMNLVELMRGAEAHFLDFGGHALSGGFSALSEKISLLKERIAELCRLNPVSGEEKPLEAEAILDLDDINQDIFRDINFFQPFGQDNPSPIFLFNNVYVRDLRKVGAEGNHLKLTLGEKGVGAIYFRSGENGFRIGDRLDILAEFQENNWNGSSKLELRIVDAKKSAY